MSCDAADLRITVKGVGALRFPLTAAQARKLRSIGRRAPFGRGTKTLHDESVRNTREVAKSRVRIDQRRWKPVFELRDARAARAPLARGARVAGPLGISSRPRVHAAKPRLGPPEGQRPRAPARWSSRPTASTASAGSPWRTSTRPGGAWDRRTGGGRRHGWVEDEGDDIDGYERREVADAQERARSLLPFWRHHSRQEEGAAFFARLVRTAGGLADAELAAGLLEPFGAARLSRGSIPPFVALVERYGARWARRVFEGWTQGRWSSRGVRLPDLVSALEASEDPEAGLFASWLLEHEVTRFEERCEADLRGGAAWLDHDGYRWLIDELEPLLRACVAGRGDASRDRLVSFLIASETRGVPVAILAALLRRLRGRRKSVPGFGRLYRHVVDGVRSIANGPERDRDDWSIQFALGCSCELCTELEEFLRDPRRSEREWPLAKDRRKHVHQVIDRLGLPVRHSTHRSGRPFKLRLRKEESLFSRERRWRDRHAQLLRWLESHGDAFEGGHSAR